MDGRAIDAVLFDFGGVLVGSPFKAVSAAGVAGGHDSDEVLDALMGYYGRDTDHPFHQLERGEIGVAEYARWMKTHLDERKMTLDLGILADFFGNLGVHAEVVDAIRRLRAEDYLTALVTNNVKEFGESWRTLVPLDELFDVVVDSSLVGMRKPNPAIYLHTLDRLGHVAPARAVFLDDAPGNVAGARAAGLQAILVDDPGTALAELDALLG